MHKLKLTVIGYQSNTLSVIVDPEVALQLSKTNNRQQAGTIITILMTSIHDSSRIVKQEEATDVNCRSRINILEENN